MGYPKRFSLIDFIYIKTIKNLRRVVIFLILITTACQETFKVHEAKVDKNPPEKIQLKRYPLQKSSMILNENSIFFWKDDNLFTPEQVAQVNSISNAMEEFKNILIRSNLGLKKLYYLHLEAMSNLTEDQKKELQQLEDNIKENQKRIEYAQKQIDTEQTKLESIRDLNKIKKYKFKIETYSEDQNHSLKEIEIKFGVHFKELYFTITNEISKDKKLTLEISKKFDDQFQKLNEIVEGLNNPPELLKLSNINGIPSIVISWENLAEFCSICYRMTVDNNSIQNLNYQELGGVLIFDLIQPLNQDVYTFELSHTKADDELHSNYFQGSVTLKSKSAKIKYGIARFSTKIDIGIYF